MSKNPYQVLNISEDATYEQIKDSYLHLSRNLHPDKQPLENYIMAKQHFQTIDKAYKSIASPLRRFVFRQYGLKGIYLMDQFPMEFKQFQEEGCNLNDKNVQRKIKHLIVYMLHEDHAMNQIDKSKFATKSIINMSRLLVQKKKNFKYTRKVPEIQKNDFHYQMPLPDFYGFSNSFGISHNSSGIQKNLNAQLDFSFSTMKRINNNILLHGQVTSQTFDLNADWIINNTTQIRFNPISIVQGQLTMPKIGFDKVFNDFSFSGITDFQHVNFQISDNNAQKGKNKLSKSVKIMIEKNAIMAMPRVQFDLTKDVKIIVQMLASLQEQNTLNFGFNYGYKLKISEQYKLQLMSYTGAQNYLQVSLYSPKFRVTLPIISQGSAVKLETYKVALFLVSFLSIKLYQYMHKKNKNLRKKVIEQEYNRLSQQKLSINKQINEVSALANQRLQKQLKFNGLVILKAFVGQHKKILNLYSQLKKFSFIKSVKQILTLKKNSLIYERLNTDLNEYLQKKNIKFGQIQDQLYQITDLYRSLVKGGQIISKKLQTFRPLLDQQAICYTMAIYINRGQIGLYFGQNSQLINIGDLGKAKSNVIKTVKSWIIDWLW